MGITALAAGTSIPDALSSVIVARNGELLLLLLLVVLLMLILLLLQGLVIWQCQVRSAATCSIF